MKFIFTIIALMAVCCIATSKIERHFFQKELENGRMDTYETIELPPSGFDEKTMYYADGGTPQYKDPSKSMLVKHKCFYVGDYGCFKGKEFNG